MNTKRNNVVRRSAHKEKRLLAGLKDNHERMIVFDWDPKLQEHIGREISMAQAAKLMKPSSNPPIDKPSRIPGKKYHCEWNDVYNQYICDLVDA